MGRKASDTSGQRENARLFRAAMKDIINSYKPYSAFLYWNISISNFVYFWNHYTLRVSAIEAYKATFVLLLKIVFVRVFICNMTLPIEPDIVRSLTSSEVTTTSVFLDWNKPLGERSFFIVRWTNSSTTPATDFNITDLTPGTNYTFTVSAVAADNKTEGSLVGLSTCTGKFHKIKCEGV